MEQGFKPILLCLTSAFLFFVTGPLHAADNPDSLRFTVGFTPDTVRVGDRIDYHIGVFHEPRFQVSFSGPDVIPGEAFSVLSREVSRPSSSLTECNAELAAFELGELLLPPVVAFVRDTLSGKTLQWSLEPQARLYVEALTDSSMKSLLPIRPIREVPVPWSRSLFTGFVVIATLALILFAGFFAWKKFILPKRRSHDHVSALHELQLLKQRLERGLGAEACYEQLSLLVRRYLEHHYDIKALEAVTSEIERELVLLDVPGALLLSGLLHEADMVKFAESSPSLEDCRNCLAEAETVLQPTESVADSKG